MAASMSHVRERLLSLPLAARTKVLESLSPEQLAELSHDWSFWARPSQLPPNGDWTFWVLMAGRGYGKTRTAAEWLRSEWLKSRRLHTLFRPHLIGATSNDVTNVMLHGVSGLLNIGPPEERPVINKVDMTLTWPDGAKGQYFSSDAPGRLRGPQCTHGWLDEIATFAASASSTRYHATDNQKETWTNFLYGFRLGEHPQAVITSTPRPQQFMRDLLKLPGVAVTRGSSYENRANLSDAFFQTIIRPYEGSRLGRQEIQGELLDDLEGALFRPAWFKDRVVRWDEAQSSFVAQDPEVALRRIVVAIDPAVSSHERSNETGIIVAAEGYDGNGYVLKDLSGVYTPDEWARLAVAAYDEFHADRIIAEVNQGGELVERALRTVRPSISYRPVHAARGKVARAEPISALYEQGKIFHRTFAPSIMGERRPLLEKLETQLTTYQAGDPSPDRLDALVWALTFLLLVDVPSARGMGQGLHFW